MDIKVAGLNLHFIFASSASRALDAISQAVRCDIAAQSGKQCLCPDKCPLCGVGMTGTVYRQHNKKTDEYKDTFYYRCHHRKRADGKLCDFATKLNQDKFNSEVEDVIRYMVREGRFC